MRLSLATDFIFVIADGSKSTVQSDVLTYQANLNPKKSFFCEPLFGQNTVINNVQRWSDDMLFVVRSEIVFNKYTKKLFSKMTRMVMKEIAKQI